jgi:hypothetical protein
MFRSLKISKMLYSVQTLKQRIEQLKSEYGLNEDKIIEFAELDPVNKGSLDNPAPYINQIIMYFKKDKNLEAKEIKNLIEKYIENKGSTKSLPGDLEKLRKELNIDDSTPAKFKGKGVKELDSDGQYRLFFVDSEFEDSPFARYPNDHPWCLNQELFYNRYKPIYLFTKGSKFYAVLTTNGLTQFNDRSNDELKGISVENFKPIKNLSLRNNLKDKIIGTNATKNLRIELYSEEELLKDNKILNHTIENEDEKTIKKLLNLGIKPDIKSLYTAIKTHNSEIVKILLDGGAKDDGNSLDWSIFYKDNKIIKLLLEYGFKPDEQNLQNANKTKNKELIEMIKGAMPKKEASSKIAKKRNKMVFNSSNEAMQKLADLTGKKVMIPNE